MAWRWPSANELADQFWESVYAVREAVWSSPPNVALVAEISDVPPSTAVDLGCGEGETRSGSPSVAGRSRRLISPQAPSPVVRRRPMLGGWGERPLVVPGPGVVVAPEQYDFVYAAYLHSPVKFARWAVL
jgi:hypothetical protein